MAKTWITKEITLENGENVKAQAPIIISASRATDIPAFFSDWFRYRFEKGYIKWFNPFNNKPLYVSFDNTRLIVFWSKNPRPIISHLDFFDSQNINYYFQYTLNDYEKEGLEKGVPNISERIKTFADISNRIGKDRIVWRFDPLLITRELDKDTLLNRVQKLGDKLVKYTNKLVFSFADISSYRKVKSNLDNDGVQYLEFNTEIMEYMAERIGKMVKDWGIEAGTCSEKIDLDKFGIKHNKCIDDELIIRNFRKDEKLMEFLGVDAQPSLFGDDEIDSTKLKDKGQREDCGCIMAKDIGQYNTCVHQCTYCYANASKESAMKNFKKYKENPNGESIL